MWAPVFSTVRAGLPPAGRTTPGPQRRRGSRGRRWRADSQRLCPAGTGPPVTLIPGVRSDTSRWPRCSSSSASSLSCSAARADRSTASCLTATDRSPSGRWPASPGSGFPWPPSPGGSGGGTCPGPDRPPPPPASRPAGPQDGHRGFQLVGGGGEEGHPLPVQLPLPLHLPRRAWLAVSRSVRAPSSRRDISSRLRPSCRSRPAGSPRRTSGSPAPPSSPRWR